VVTQGNDIGRAMSVLEYTLLIQPTSPLHTASAGVANCRSHQPVRAVSANSITAKSSSQLKAATILTSAQSSG
jgi:hypothetical protein